MRRWISGFRCALEGGRGLVLSLYTALIFCAYFVMTASRTEDLIKWCVLVTVLSFLGCPALLRWVRGHAFSDRAVPAVSSAGGKEQPRERLRERVRWSLFFFFVPFVLFLVKYLAYYPGAFSTDSIEQLGQVYSGHYNDWHPVFQTILALGCPSG